MLSRTLIIIFMALVIGAVHSSHHFFMRGFLAEEGKKYQPLVLSSQVHNSTIDETFVYAARVREAYDGSFPLRETSVREFQGKSSLLVSETLPATLMAAMAHLSGSVPNAFIIADFVFPALIFLACFGFIRLVTDNYLVSLAGAISLFFLQVFFYDFPYLPSAIKEMIDYRNFSSLLWFSRSFHPQISFLFLLLAIFFLFKGSFAAAGFAFGLLLYNYFFYWTWFLAGFLVFILFGAKKEKYFFKHLAEFFIVFFITSLPFLANTIGSYGGVNGFLSRANYYNLSSFQWIPIIRVIFFSFVFWIIIPQAKSRIHYLIQSFLLGSVLLFLVPSLLKFDLDDMVGHWNKFAVNSWIIISLFLVLGTRFKKSTWCLPLLLLLPLYGMVYHWQFAKKNYLAYQMEESQSQVYQWLNANTRRDEVVLTLSLKQNLAIPAFTHNNVFIPNFTSPASTDEITARLIFAYRLAGLDYEALGQLFTDQNPSLALGEKWDLERCGGWYVYFYQKGTASRYLCGISGALRKNLRLQYENLVSSAQYRWDYILLGPREKDIKAKDFWQLIYQNQDFRLYSLSLKN